MTPKVSIIIPVYNVDKYLADCLKSVLLQSLKEIEIICVNDASNDNSAFILQEFEKMDTRLRVINHQENLGLGAARNTGVSHASASYIGFVDSDDFIAPDMFLTLYNAIKASEADLAWCGMSSASHDGIILTSDPIPEGLFTTEETLQDPRLYPSILSVCNKLFRRELFVKIKQLPIISEDQPALAEYFLSTSIIVIINKSLYYYRQNYDSLSKPTLPDPSFWNDFFFSHQLFFHILKKKYSENRTMRIQVLLRHFSLLWRIRKFQLLNISSWPQHEKTLLHHLKNNKIGLKSYSPSLYWFLLFTFSINWPIKIKKELIKVGVSLARNKLIKKESVWILFAELLRSILNITKLLVKSGIMTIEILGIRMLAKIHRTIIKEPIWLIGERPDTAQDNGYFFFKYIMNEKPEIKAYYIITKTSKQYLKLKKFNRCINFNSIYHKLLFIRCKYYVTSHNHYCFPTFAFGRRRYQLSPTTINVFLQHGITYSDNSNDYGKSNSLINLFICGANPEYKFILEKFGYSQNEVVLTGFARFDGFYNSSSKKQILFMPTWRKDIWMNRMKNNQDHFKNSNYYKVFQSLINNKRLNNLLHKYNFFLLFYPHYEIQPFLSTFSTESDRIILASKEDFNVHQLLNESALLITDSSSTNFDFAYMLKPLLYYFFDRDDFNLYHLKPGYFNHKTSGFGEIAENEDTLIDELEKLLENNCSMPAKYQKRVHEFFPFRDNENCERIYKAIVAFQS